MFEKSAASTDALGEEEQKTLLDIMLAKSQTFQTVRSRAGAGAAHLHSGAPARRRPAAPRP
jgi:hypothetical protein